MTSQEIRTAFLEFFKQNGHLLAPSAPIVLKDDPTLMFTNAGMNQFKSYFLGEAAPPAPRIADTQKCLRVSGKHNDLEEVGVDTYHHTMFEMLGNWSFGDYFKETAIRLAWELLTEVYNLDKNRLYVTVYEGDDSEGVPKDIESERIWTQLVPADHIILGNKKDNFWEMGDTGPCGPSTEIHFDNRSQAERDLVAGAALVNKDHEQVIEIWNLVFIQFNRLKNGNLTDLPAKHVDTGMGFERLVRVINGKRSNYDTDVFIPLLHKLTEITQIAYGEGNEQTDIAFRVIADHVRAISFSIADGQLPGNAKAGYVIRRILRRAVRYAYTFLKVREPVIYKLVEVLAEQFSEVFNELVQQKEFIKKVIMEEESLFLKTLVAGISRFDKYTADEGIVSGSFAFELYDTYGFPPDLTQLMAKEKGWKVDEQGFNSELEAQKSRSKKANILDAGDWVEVETDGEHEFLGYDMLNTDAKIQRYRKVIDKGREYYQIVLDKTPFYAEGGGQVGDTGILVDKDGQKIKVLNTRKENQQNISSISELPKDLHGVFSASVDAERRADIEKNHSATHLLHAALKHVLGAHVNQKGSLVTSDYLRFDFAHFNKMSDEELQRVEDLVNEKIWSGIPLNEYRDIPYKDAIDSGVTALFGEKYGDRVRMIVFDDNYSKELCGGTHVKNTGTIGLFKITSETSVAAGVRRIEAKTGKGAFRYMQQFQIENIQANALFKSNKPLLENIQLTLSQQAEMKRQLSDILKANTKAQAAEMNTRVYTKNGKKVLVEKVTAESADQIKNLSAEIQADIVVLFALLREKPYISVQVNNSDQFSATEIIKSLASLIGGGGGGNRHYATAGGKNAAGLDNIKMRANELL